MTRVRFPVVAPASSRKDVSFLPMFISFNISECLRKLYHSVVTAAHKSKGGTSSATIAESPYSPRHPSSNTLRHHHRNSQHTSHSLHRKVSELSASLSARAAGTPRQGLPEVNHTHLSSTYVSFLDKPKIQVDLVEYVMVMDEAPTSSRRCSEGFDGISSNPPHYASDMF